MERLGVDTLLAIVGLLPKGEKCIMKTEIFAKDLKSTILDLSSVLDNSKKVGKKEGSGQARKVQTDSEKGRIQLLSWSNFEVLYGEKTLVYIIGAFRYSKAQEKLESILSLVSQKSLSRRPNHRASSSRDRISYALLDAAKHQSFQRHTDLESAPLVD
ncbi:hypothetical protein VNO77_02985 [Canavalia gladiata]|uniref:Uncharacterized protein n=1 Tax=Canavalia gladiata TaxID=3824 RepID=A0AAN9R7R2_CANGL